MFAVEQKGLRFEETLSYWNPPPLRRTFNGWMVTDFASPHLAVNPFSKQHGAPSDSERHVGDLGNYETDAQGNAKGSVTDEHIKLIGQESVLGVRAP